MKQEHINSVYEIECTSFSTPWSIESINDELKNQMATYIVAAEGEDVLGYAGLWHVVNEGHINNIAVKEEYRGQGIGDLLLEGLINIAVEKEMIGLTLEVRVGNEKAMKLYSKHGFKVEGLRKNYYSDTREDAVVMWKYL
jgi:ribosomal-protein-alanine N-acetyltransferase